MSSPRAGRLTLAWVLAALVAVPLAAAAPVPAWRAPVRLSPAGDPGPRPFFLPVSVAIDPTGGALVVWHVTDSADRVIARSRVRAADGPWQPPESIPGEGTVEVALPEGGPALALRWRDSGPVTFSERPLHGSWSPPATVPFAVGRAALVAEPSGAALVGWASGGVAWVTRRSRAGEWEPPVALSPADQEVRSAPQIAVDQAGRALASWSAHAPLPGFIVHAGTAAAVRDPTGRWSPAEWVSPPRTGLSQGSGPEVVAIGEDGTALVVFSRYGGSLASVRPPGGPWGPEIPVSLRTSVAFAEGSAGFTLVDAEARLSLQRVTTAGLTGAPDALIPADAGTERGTFAVGPSGVALAAWTRTLGPADPTGSLTRVWARVRDDGGGWGAALPVSPRRYFARPVMASAVDARGNALLVWREQRTGAVVAAEYRTEGLPPLATGPPAASRRGGRVVLHVAVAARTTLRVRAVRGRAGVGAALVRVGPGRTTVSLPAGLSRRLRPGDVLRVSASDAYHLPASWRVRLTRSLSGAATPRRRRSRCR